MRFFKTIFLLPLSLAFFTSCGDTELSASNTVDLPVVEILCDIEECAPGLPTAFALVFLSSSACDEEFSVLYSSTSSFICDEENCSGTTSGGWIDASGGAVTEVSQTALFVCVHIDKDGSGAQEFTSGDIFYSKLTPIDGASVLQAGPSGWAVY